MWFQLRFQVNAILLLILLTRQSSALKYLFVPEDDDFFEDCENTASNVLNINGLADMSEITFKRNNDVISLSGNATFIWNIEAGDRLMMKADMYKYDRGNWQQTPFGITVPDSCHLLYDEPQYWYQYWTKHIINRNEIKNQCFYPGTRMIHEPFEVKVEMQFTGLPLTGRHKVVATLRAYDKKNIERATSICVQVLGEFERLT